MTDLKDYGSVYVRNCDETLMEFDAFDVIKLK